MGGFGSGRPAVHATCEQSLKLDLASPATRRALKPNAWATGSWHWSSHGRQIASIGYVWWGREAALTLRYNHDGEAIVQRIDLVATVPEFGGKRWWFVCPLSGARVRALYLPPGGKLWGSRQAYKLSYQSQRESGQGRALVRMLTRNGTWPGDPMMAAVLADARDPLGFREERRWERREEARKRRSEVRRIARRQNASPL